MLAAPKGVGSSQQWIDRNARSQMAQTRTEITLHRAGSAAPIQVIEVVSAGWSDSASNQYQDVDCYFEIEGRLFAGRLEYWRGDPKANERRQTLHRMIERMRLLEKRN
jgi:hypothetical protein